MAVLGQRGAPEPPESWCFELGGKYRWQPPYASSCCPLTSRLICIVVLTSEKAQPNAHAGFLLRATSNCKPSLHTSNSTIYKGQSDSLPLSSEMFPKLQQCAAVSRGHSLMSMQTVTLAQQSPHVSVTSQPGLTATVWMWKHQRLALTDMTIKACTESLLLLHNHPGRQMSC
jgi:hypothetical protein